MPSPVREKFATQVDPDILARVRDLARSEGRQVQVLVEEALTDLVEKRRQGKPRANVMAAYQRSHAEFSSLYKKLGEELTSYDPAEGLDSEKAVAVFMEEAFKTEDASYIAHAVRVVARAKGMTQIASDAGISREQLYRAFSENGNATFQTTVAVIKALGIKMAAKAHA
jgi:probable addiction module antidote protein